MLGSHIFVMYSINNKNIYIYEEGSPIFVKIDHFN